MDSWTYIYRCYVTQVPQQRLAEEDVGIVPLSIAVIAKKKQKGNEYLVIMGLLNVKVHDVLCWHI